MYNEDFSGKVFPNEILAAAALNPSLIGPTLPPIPPFTFPTGLTGPSSKWISISRYS
ncbi:exosporium leader peptide-containing protein [Bacillus toyonensis]|uniref:exosporium leader peptide-containing protein n=1 Tax=Bacillus toyonensis TaxID=155322 RepID=UPI00399CD61D